MSENEIYSWPDPNKDNRLEPDQASAESLSEDNHTEKLQVPSQSRGGKSQQTEEISTLTASKRIQYFANQPVAKTNTKSGCLLAAFLTIIGFILFIFPGWNTIYSSIFPPSVGVVGTPVSYDGYMVLVNQVEKADSYTPDKLTSGSNIVTTQAAPGYQFVFVDIIYTSGNDNNEIMSIFYNSPRLIDNQGVVYESNGEKLGLRTPTLANAGGTETTSGKTVRGWITFEIPKTAQGLLLSFPLINNFHYDGADSNRRRIPIKLDDQATTNPPPLAKAIGTTGTVDQVVGDESTLLVVNSVVLSDQLETVDGIAVKAANGKKFVVLNVTITSQTDSGINVNPDSAVLKDSNNVSYNFYKSIYCPYQPSLATVENVPKGFKVQGRMCLQVPADSSGYRLEYHSSANTPVNLEVNLGN